MPKEIIHEQKKVKNYMLLGVFLLLVVAIFLITIIRLSEAGKILSSQPVNSISSHEKE